MKHFAELKPLSKFVLCIAAMLLLAACGLEETFQPEWKQATEQVIEILKAHNIVSKEHPNAAQDIIGAGGFTGGFYVLIHGIKDQALLGEIAQPYIDQFNKTPAISKVEIKAYSFTEREDLNEPIIKRLIEGPILDIELRRK